jgi:hypothetical protein
VKENDVICEHASPKCIPLKCEHAVPHKRDRHCAKGCRETGSVCVPADGKKGNRDGSK